MPELAPARRLPASKAIGEAFDGGSWRGVALYVHEHGEWTIIDDLSGHMAVIPASRWRDLAEANDLVFAGYNDSVPCGQLIVIRRNQIVREFLDDCQDPRHNVNLGRLEFEEGAPIKSWIEAASFVDGDDLADLDTDDGLLWIFQHPAATVSAQSNR